MCNSLAPVCVSGYALRLRAPPKDLGLNLESLLMRRAAAVCLLLFFVFCAYSTSLAERRPDLSSSSKGFGTGTCATNQGGTIPWFVAAPSNPAPLYYPAG